MATPQGTEHYASRFNLPAWAWRQVRGLRLTTLGLGTYCAVHDLDDARHAEVIAGLIRQGCNVIDTAPNYRDGHSETAVGIALKTVQAEGICHDETFVATKVGLPHPDLAGKLGGLGPEGSCYRSDTVVVSLEGSLKRLGLAAVDCVFIHNLEFLKMANPGNFSRSWRLLAETMESCCGQGLCRSWGISSWSGFRVPEDRQEHLSLANLVDGQWPHLGYLQVPFGFWGPEVLTEPCQGGRSLLQQDHSLSVFSNSPLLQGELVPLMPDAGWVGRAIRFARDTPGVSTVLLGISSAGHMAQWRLIQSGQPEIFTKERLLKMEAVLA